jgi:hypothetical protein
MIASSVPSRPDPAQRTPIDWGLLLAGLTVFGALNFGIYLLAVERDPVPWAILLAAAAALIAGLSFRRSRSFAYGVLGGYVLMTLITAGGCTFTFSDPFHSAAIVGFLFYPFVLAALTAVLAVRRVLVWLRERQ